MKPTKIIKKVYGDGKDLKAVLIKNKSTYKVKVYSKINNKGTYKLMRHIPNIKTRKSADNHFKKLVKTF